MTADDLSKIYGVPVVSACVWHTTIDGMKTYSEANQREHWARKNARVNEQKRRVFMALSGASFRAYIKTPPRLVKIIRIGKRNLDSDNLASAFKATRDQVAASLGINDGSPSTAWAYGQERGPVGVRIEFWR